MTVTNRLFYYKAYGLNIASEIKITGFEPVQAGVPDVTVTIGVAPENLENTVNQGVLFRSNDHEFLIRVDNVAAYYVKNGDSITVEPCSDMTSTELSAFLTGTSFGALLHQRKMLPLHASAVVYNKKCLVFMGVSGAGKTTTAAAFIKNGARLVADDISVIDFTGDKPAVTPAFPTVKIWKDSLKHLDIPGEGLDHVCGELEKFYLPVENYVSERQPIDAIFMLNSHNKPDVVIEPVDGVRKFQVIKRHTYLFRGIPKTGLEANHFKLASELVKHVPVYTLTRSNAEFNTSGIVETVSSLVAKNA